MSVSTIASRSQTPKGLRLHIGLFGKRNAGKSSLVNALTGQTISIVSDVPGTTADPVEKAFELPPVGPVVLIDTAGVDDEGKLGDLRSQRSFSVLDWVDLALIVSSSSDLTQIEWKLIDKTCANKTPVLIVFNQFNEITPTKETLDKLTHKAIPFVCVSAKTKKGIENLHKTIVTLLQGNTEPDRPMLDGVLKKGDTVILVTPIDTGAPKGRLILPQVQAIREILDSDAKCLIVREDRLSEAIENEKQPPSFVITDSQVVLKVCNAVSKNIPVTTFSIQMANCKADLVEMARGAAMLSHLKPYDKIMVCETCSHHPQADDIGRNKIPRWLSEKIGGPLNVDIVVGKDFPTDLSAYKLILQCGGCVVTRRHMMARIKAARAQGVPMTNYGVAISYLQGVLERTLEMHPLAYRAYQEEKARLDAKDKNEGS